MFPHQCATGAASAAEMLAKGEAGRMIIFFREASVVEDPGNRRVWRDGGTWAPSQRDNTESASWPGRRSPYIGYKSRQRRHVCRDTDERIGPEPSRPRVQGVRLLAAAGQRPPTFSIPDQVGIAHWASAMAGSPRLSPIEHMWVSGSRIRSRMPANCSEHSGGNGIMPLQNPSRTFADHFEHRYEHALKFQAL
jgi:hypothetical protein